MNIHERYLQYSRAMRSIGITPLSEGVWMRAITHPPQSKLTDAQFDHDTERREGWANGE